MLRRNNSNFGVYHITFITYIPYILILHYSCFRMRPDNRAKVLHSILGFTFTSTSTSEKQSVLGRLSAKLCLYPHLYRHHPFHLHTQHQRHPQFQSPITPLSMIPRNCLHAHHMTMPTPDDAYNSELPTTLITLVASHSTILPRGRFPTPHTWLCFCPCTGLAFSIPQ